MSADRIVDRVGRAAIASACACSTRESREVAHQRARARAAAHARAAFTDRRDRQPLGAPRRRDRLRRAHSSGRSAMRVVHVIGARASLHVTAAGKLFLLGDGFARLRDYAKRTAAWRSTPGTPSPACRCSERDLERTQRQGWRPTTRKPRSACAASRPASATMPVTSLRPLALHARRSHEGPLGPLIKETAGPHLGDHRAPSDEPHRRGLDGTSPKSPNQRRGSVQSFASLETGVRQPGPRIPPPSNLYEFLGVDRFAAVEGEA